MSFIKVHSQDSLIIDRIVPREEITYDYESYDLALIDKATEEPITGWVKYHSKKVLYYRHYVSGELDGYSVRYAKGRKNYRLEEIAKYRQGEIQTKAFFSSQRVIRGA